MYSKVGLRSGQRKANEIITSHRKRPIPLGLLYARRRTDELFTLSLGGDVGGTVIAGERVLSQANKE